MVRGAAGIDGGVRVCGMDWTLGKVVEADGDGRSTSQDTPLIVHTSVVHSAFTLAYVDGHPGEVGKPLDAGKHHSALDNCPGFQAGGAAILGATGAEQRQYTAKSENHR